MKNIIFGIFFLICFTVVNAQVKTNYPSNTWLGKGEFVITGNVLNKPETMKSWNLAVTDYISNIGYEIPVQGDGSFNKTLPITDVQDIYLYLGDAVTIFSFPGDTIQITFDAAEKIETLEIKGPTEERSRELNLCLEIYRNFRQSFLSSSRLAYDRTKSNEEKLTILNDYYDKKIDFITRFESQNGPLPFLQKFQDGTYFEIASIAARIDVNTTATQKILPGINCNYNRLSYERIDQKTSGTDTTQVVVPPYELLSYSAFRTTPNYRGFIRAYIGSQSQKVFSWTEGYPQPGDRKPIQLYSSFTERYDMGKKLLAPVPPIRDWYLSEQLNQALTYNSITEVDESYQDFLTICEDTMYLSALEPVYQQALSLAPGKPAPDFELKDLDGRTVRLSDLKGKIVHIDFWGRGCGPCIYEFNNSKDAFLQKYGYEDIVFLYICVDSKEEQWKKSVEKYKLDGINLLAEGWDDNPVCQAYNVKGIPHYVLIDKEGMIVKNNCDRPSIMLEDGKNNDLEKLLLRYK